MGPRNMKFHAVAPWYQKIFCWAAFISEKEGQFKAISIQKDENWCIKQIKIHFVCFWIRRSLFDNNTRRQSLTMSLICLSWYRAILSFAYFIMVCLLHIYFVCVSMYFYYYFSFYKTIHFIYVSWAWTGHAQQIYVFLLPT